MARSDRGRSASSRADAPSWYRPGPPTLPTRNDGENPPKRSVSNTANGRAKIRAAPSTSSGRARSRGPRPTPPHASNLRWTIGQTLISYSWTAPSGYSRFRVTFDGDSYDIRRTSCTASNLIPGLSYRFGVQTMSADGTELSGRLSVTLQTDCADIDDCGRTRSLASSFGDGIYLVGPEVEAGNYMIGTQPEDKICEWGRLANLDGSDGQEIEVGGYEADKTVTIESTDHAFFTFNCGTWEQQE